MKQYANFSNATEGEKQRSERNVEQNVYQRNLFICSNLECSNGNRSIFISRRFFFLRQNKNEMNAIWKFENTKIFSFFFYFNNNVIFYCTYLQFRHELEFLLSLFRIKRSREMFVHKMIDKEQWWKRSRFVRNAFRRASARMIEWIFIYVRLNWIFDNYVCVFSQFRSCSNRTKKARHKKPLKIGQTLFFTSRFQTSRSPFLLNCHRFRLFNSKAFDFASHLTKPSMTYSLVQQIATRTIHEKKKIESKIRKGAPIAATVHKLPISPPKNRNYENISSLYITSAGSVLFFVCCWWKTK